MFDLIRLGNKLHLVARGTAHTGKFLCTLTQAQAWQLGWHT